MSIVACSLSRKPDPCQTKIYNNFKEINKFSKIDLKLKHNNTKMGLGEYYNQCIEEYAENYDYMLFVHDDVSIINMDLEYQIKKGMEKYDVLGIAGCTSPQIKDVNLWHLMSERANLRGFAGHSCVETNNEFHITTFGASPSRVAIIDGVFMAVNCKKVLKSNTRFDIKFMFHHYDMDFSLQCNLNKLKIGTWPILIDHSSPGLREFTDDWKKSNEYFKNKWKTILKN
jgi:GT2 family glycosyltransferase